MHRILHVCGVRWWSAIAAYAVDLAEAQARAGHRVSFAALEGSPAAAAARARGLAVDLTFGPDPWHQNSLRRVLAAEVREAHVDVLHVHTGVGHLAAELARRRVPTALVRTRGDVRPPAVTPWNRWLYRRADAIVLSARVLGEGVASFGLPEGRVSVVLGGVDTERFSPATLPARGAARRRLGVPDGAFVAGIVARLSPVKGHAHAMRALAREEAAEVHLLVSGEAAQLRQADLLAEARALGVGARVHITDRCDDVREIFAAIDAGLVASTGSEAICRVAAEMMAAGLPVVASRVGVLPDMFDDDVDGVLVAPADAAAIARALAALARDRTRAERLGRAARERACRELALEVVADRYEDVYDRARRRRT